MTTYKTALFGLDDAALACLLTAVRAVPHVAIVRLGTRAPVETPPSTGSS